MVNDRVTIKVIHQGKAVCGKYGYGLARGENVAAFYVDGWGETGRIYPCTSSSSVLVDGKSYDYPTISFEDGKDNEGPLTEICFPEFAGFRVHAANGGKTMAVCLLREVQG